MSWRMDAQARNSGYSPAVCFLAQAHEAENRFCFFTMSIQPMDGVRGRIEHNVNVVIFQEASANLR
jgi:hypothetical protein